MLKKILVPVDGTDHSWRALEYAVAAAKLSGGSLVLLTVAKPGLKGTGGIALEEELAYSADGPVMQIGNEVLEAAKILIDKQHLVCDYLLAMGEDIADEIIRLGKRECCDTIIVGSRGFGVLEGLLKNSVSKNVVEAAQVPVIVIK